MARLSLVTPSYNHAHYLPAMVETVMTQSRLPDEFLIADDVSPDNTPEVLRELSLKYPLLDARRNERNLGVNGAYNALFERATSDYVFGQSSDDFFLPGGIEALMRVAEKYPQAGLVCGRWIRWHETPSEATGKTEPEQYEMNFGMPDHECYLSPEECVALSRRGVLSFSGAGSVYKRSGLIECGKYREELRWQADAFVTAVLACRYGIAWTPHRVSVMRIIPAGYSHPSKQTRRQHLDVYRAMADLFGQPAFLDVRRRYARTGHLAIYGLDALRVLLEKPSRWGLLSGHFLSLQFRAFLRRSPLLQSLVRRFRPVPKWNEKTRIDFSQK